MKEDLHSTRPLTQPVLASPEERRDLPEILLLSHLQTLDPRVRKIIALIQADLRQEFQMEEIAALVNLSPRQIRRLFQQELGCAPQQLLRRLRLAKAQELLVTTFLLVKEIAEQVGMSDVNHFIREFRKAYGLTPETYRRQASLEKNSADVRTGR